MVRRSGRRPGNQDTRQSILESARAVFAETGYDKASVRAIAASAQVDPARLRRELPRPVQARRA